ncbi:MAG: FAD-dependent oxidoreductase [Chloroflexi bacterium]|nr:FAD-dependent oxidoreductase [Chloroflexota bacterium]
MAQDYEVVVVGGGLAGLTAGLFAARYGRTTLVLEPQMPGGHLANVEKVEDFPGFPEGVAGYELGPSVQEQAANEGAELRLAGLQRLEPVEGGWLVTTDEGQYRAESVIVAAGSRPRELGVPGERRLYGRGVSHCASCDGPLFRDQKVGVVAEDAWALQEALTLMSYASEVVLFHRSDAVAGQHRNRQRVVDHAKVTLRPNTAVEEVLGEDVVSGVRVRHTATGQEGRVELAGLFVYAGLEPNTALLRGLLRLDEDGRVPTDIWMRTERPGLLAAGDIRRDSASQAITAAGDGATAAIAAHRYLEDSSWPGLTTAERKA